MNKRDTARTLEILQAAPALLEYVYGPEAHLSSNGQTITLNVTPHICEYVGGAYDKVPLSDFWDKYFNKTYMFVEMASYKKWGQSMFGQA